MTNGPFDLDPARIRESMVRLDLIQFARGEMHVVRQDLRETLDRDLKEYKRELRSRDLKIFSLALTVASLLIGGDVWTMRQTIDRVEKRAEEAVNKEIEATRARARAVLAAEVQSIQYEVSERLNREFEAPRIRILVEEKAKDYAERQARAYLTERVDQSIKPYNERITTAFAQIDALRNLLFIAERAMDGALPSYLQLLDISREKSESGEIAIRKLSAIQRDLAQYRYPPAMYQGLSFTRRTDGKPVPAEQAATSDLFAMLQDPSLQAIQRHTLMAYLVGKPKAEIAAEATKLIRNSQYLPAIAATCGVLGTVFNDQTKFLDMKAWLDFLQKQ